MKKQIPNKRTNFQKYYPLIKESVIIKIFQS